MYSTLCYRYQPPVPPLTQCPGQAFEKLGPYADVIKACPGQTCQLQAGSQHHGVAQGSTGHRGIAASVAAVDNERPRAAAAVDWQRCDTAIDDDAVGSPWLRWHRRIGAQGLSLRDCVHPLHTWCIYVMCICVYVLVRELQARAEFA